MHYDLKDWLGAGKESVGMTEKSTKQAELLKFLLKI
jgi:hypothetical protein